MYTFHTGCAVEVYRGPPRGWVPALVHTASAAVLESGQMAEPLSRHSPGYEAHQNQKGETAPAALTRTSACTIIA